MAFINGTIQLQAYLDSAQTVFPQLSLPNFNATWNNSSVTSIEPLYFNLAASGSKTINFNGLTGITEFYLYSDATALTIALNGGSAISYKAATPGYIPLAATSMVIVNASGTTATNVTLVLIAG